jgi:hypothetical protein
MKMLLVSERLVGRKHWVLAALFGAGLAAASVAYADYLSVGFEQPGYVGSAGGTLLTGQDGYYLPAGSADFNVYTYTGNPFGLPQNPQGGAQFVAGTALAGTTFARAQRDLTWGTGRFTMSLDMAGHYPGPLPALNNVGSVSVQAYPGSRSYLQLFSYPDPATASVFQAGYLMYTDASGTVADAQPGRFPGPEWQNLALDHWYRFESVIDYDLAQVVQAAITDLTTGSRTQVDLSGLGYYLGAGGIPTGYRLFAGGANTAAYDNVRIVPEPAAALLMLLSGLVVARRR